MPLVIKLIQNSTDPNIVDFVTKNNSSNSIEIIKWGTPLDDLPNDILNFKLDSDDIKLEYIGPKFRRVFDPIQSKIILAPQETRVVPFNISENYRFESPNYYTVSLPKKLVITSLDSSNITFASNELTLYCEPRKSKFMSDMKNSRVDTDEEAGSTVPATEQAGPRCPPPAVLCLKPNYGSNTDGFCVNFTWFTNPPFDTSVTPAQKKIVLDLYKLMVPKVFRFRISDTPAYRKWFGEYSDANRNEVARVLRGMTGGYGCKGFRIFNWNSNCGGDTLAWHRPSPDPSEYPDAINFCPRFWNLPEKGLNSKVGTIAHELTHYSSGTQDYFYQYNDCVKLAASNPAKAIRNANNYSYFVEENVFI